MTNRGTYPHSPELSGRNDLLLTHTDVVWLSELACREIDEQDLERANSVLPQGSVHLRDDPGSQRAINPGQRQATIEARTTFFEEVLGWSDEKHPLHGVYTALTATLPYTRPLDTVVGFFRACHEADLKLADVVRKAPKLMTLGSDGMHEHINELARLGLDIPGAVNTHPQLLSYSPELIREKISFLELLRIDAHRVVRASPSILGFNVASLARKVNNLRQLGLDAERVVAAHPAVLTVGIEFVHEKLKQLEQFGLDAVKVTNTLPQAINLSAESITQRINNFAEQGLDAAMIINAQPTLLGLNPESARIKLIALKRPGFKDEHIDYPTVLRTLTAPVEALLAYTAFLSDEGTLATDELTKRPARARAYIQAQGAFAGSERKAYFKDTYVAARTSVGCMAVLLARYNKLDVHSHLGGETIPAETLLKKPDYPLVSS